MAGVGSSSVPQNGSLGPTQIIGGKSYTMYSPDWYAAQDADKIHQSTVAGQAGAAGTTAAINGTQGALSGLLGALGAGGGTGGSTSAITGLPTGGAGSVTAGGAGISGGGGVGAIAPIDTSAADSASFAAAKDQAGQTARSSVNSLRGLLGETGQLGGGAESAATRALVEQAAQGSNDVSRQQAVTHSANALDLAKTNQGAAITQRGQDIAAQEANASLAMQQAQLNSQRQLSLLQTALGMANLGANY